MPNPNDLSYGTRSQEEIDSLNAQLDNQKQSMANDASYDTISKFALRNGVSLNDETLDYIYNQYFTEKNNTTAWERSLEADSTKYQRAVEDMKKAGLNPFLLMSGAGGSSPSASTGSVGSGSVAAIKNAKRQQNTSYGTSILSALATLAGAAIIALVK